MVKTTCWSTKEHQNGGESDFELGIVVSISETSDQLGHGSTLPRVSCSGCCWWCNCVWDIFWAHFGPLSTNWALFEMLQPTQVLLLNMSILRWTQYEHNLQRNNAPCHKAQIISKYFLVHCTPMAPTVTRSQQRTFGMWWNGKAYKSSTTVWCYQYGPNLVLTIPMFNLCREELIHFWGQRGSIPVPASRCT